MKSNNKNNGGVDMVVFCVDLKSFYASVESVLRGLDPFTTNLVVADKERGPGSIVLAVTPHLKNFGAKSRCRIYELPKVENIIYAKPRMRKYIEFSSKIYEIYLKYVDKEDIHIYSIDEAFLDMTTYMKYYNMNAIDLAKKILKDIFDTTKITATCGIGDNMFLAKVALDILAKHQPDNIAYLNEATFKEKIWNIKPLREIWGIGSRLERRLARMNIYTLKDLANTSVEKLEKEFGIIGNELYLHAHGIDHSTVQEVKNYHPQSKSFGHGQVLYQDYNYKDLYIVLLETVDEIATELVTRRLCCQVLGLGIGYSQDIGGGFFRQLTLETKTNSRKRLMEGFKKLYYDNIEDLPIRQIQVRVGRLQNEDFIQQDIFTDVEKTKKEHDLYDALGKIKNKYGKSSVHLAISNDDKATLIKRNSLIGGHNAE